MVPAGFTTPFNTAVAAPDKLAAVCVRQRFVPLVLAPVWLPIDQAEPKLIEPKVAEPNEAPFEACPTVALAAQEVVDNGESHISNFTEPSVWDPASVKPIV